VTRLGVALALALLVVPSVSGAPPRPAQAGTPPGSDWLVGGSRPQDYRVELEPKGGRLGTAAALIQGAVAEPRGFVSLMRHVDAAPYRGGRLRLRAWLKSEDLAGWAGLWMRVDDLDGSLKVLAFDNMGDRRIEGTTGWRSYDVVLEVPEAADQVYYGALVEGRGRLWVDEVTLEPVGDDVPVTGTSGLRRDAPVNLDFDHPPGRKDAPPP